MTHPKNRVAHNLSVDVALAILSNPQLHALDFLQASSETLKIWVANRSTEFRVDRGVEGEQERADLCRRVPVLQSWTPAAALCLCVALDDIRPVIALWEVGIK